MKKCIFFKFFSLAQGFIFGDLSENCILVLKNFDSFFFFLIPVGIFLCQKNGDMIVNQPVRNFKHLGHLKINSIVEIQKTKIHRSKK